MGEYDPFSAKRSSDQVSLVCNAYRSAHAFAEYESKADVRKDQAATACSCHSLSAINTAQAPGP